MFSFFRSKFTSGFARQLPQQLASPSRPRSARSLSTALTTLRSMFFPVFRPGVRLGVRSFSTGPFQPKYRFARPWSKRWSVPLSTIAVIGGTSLFFWQTNSSSVASAAPVSREKKKERKTEYTVPKPEPVPHNLPVVMAEKTYAPNVPPPITRDYPVRLVVDIDSTVDVLPASGAHKFPFWTFDGHVPGPFIRTRVGDVLEVHYSNNDQNGVGHNIDFHGVIGPGGGAPVLYAEQGETKTGIFKMVYPGLYFYHCAAAPVPTHVATGMYGLLLVEPEEGLPKVDKEFYVMQSEIYADVDPEDKQMLEYNYANGLEEHPMYVVFNGREGALTEISPLQVKQNERVRFFFGNAGPNLVSSFHIIGTVFDKVWREGDLISPPARYLQTTLVPAGGAAMIELDTPVPGNFTLVDHSIFRIDKGAIGFLKVSGSNPRKDIYDATDRPQPCPGCKLHN